MRAINPKSNPLRCLVGDGGWGGASIGGDCAGAKEPLPGLALEGDAGVACPPGVAAEYLCVGER